MDRDPSDERWLLLGIIDAQKNASYWDRPTDWVLERNFPAQYYTEMNSILNRAIAVTGDDQDILRSLYFDVEMLDTRIQYPKESREQSLFSEALEFSRLSRTEEFTHIDLDWRKYFAVKAIERLSFSLFMYIYRPEEQLEPVVEINGNFEQIDPIMAEVHAGISSASEFVVLAEIWPVIKGLHHHVDREVKRKITQIRKEQGSKGGKNKHAPIAELKENFYSYYLEHTNFSYAECARRFLKTLPQNEEPKLSSDNAVRTLSEFLGRRIKQENEG